MFFLQKLRIKLRKLEVFQKWLLADHRQIRKNLKEDQNQIKKIGSYEKNFNTNLFIGYQL